MVSSPETRRYAVYIITSTIIAVTASLEVVLTKNLTSSLIIAITGAVIVVYLISILMFEDFVSIKKESIKVEEIHQLSKSLLEKIGLFPILYKSDIEFEILDRGESYTKVSTLVRNAKKRVMLIYRTPAFFFTVKMNNPGDREEKAFVEIMNKYVLPKCQQNSLDVIIGFNHLDSLFTTKVNELSDEELNELLVNVQKWNQYMETSNLRLFSFGEINTPTPNGITNIELVDDVLSMELMTYPNSRWKLRIKNEEVSEMLFEQFRKQSSEGMNSAIDFLINASKTRRVKA